MYVYGFQLHSCALCMRHTCPNIKTQDGILKNKYTVLLSVVTSEQVYSASDVTRK